MLCVCLQMVAADVMKSFNECTNMEELKSTGRRYVLINKYYLLYLLSTEVSWLLMEVLCN